MSVNKCLFIGNLTADPEIRTMPNGEQVANFTIALNERYKAKDGNIVEENSTAQILKEPKNEYTKLLIRAAIAD